MKKKDVTNPMICLNGLIQNRILPISKKTSNQLRLKYAKEKEVI